jgi:rRNA-processing protein FCF1
VRRSTWPNVPADELVRLVTEWAAREDVDARVIFESSETADDTIAREAASEDRYWLVTSDRGLRERAAPRAERVIGGGSFLRRLRGAE